MRRVGPGAPMRRTGVGRFGALLAVLLVVQLTWALGRVAGSMRQWRPRRCRRRRLGARVGPRALHRLRVRLRGDVDLILAAMVGAVLLARRGRPVIPLGHYLVVSATLFAIGVAGVFLRRNLITILLSIEIMLNAVNLSFVAFGRSLGTVDGQIITFFVMTVAAAEAAVGLAIVIGLFRHRESLSPDAFTSLKW
jgi:NADH-quinone oxidoreductase subunit K